MKNDQYYFLRFRVPGSRRKLRFNAQIRLLAVLCGWAALPFASGLGAAAEASAPTVPNPLQQETTLTPTQAPTSPFGDLPTEEDDASATGIGRPNDAGTAREQRGQSDDTGDIQSLLLMDPLARTALQMSQTNAETLIDGVGGVPRPLSSLYLNQDMNTTGGFVRGDLTVNPTLSLGANYRTTSGDRNGGNSTEVYGLLSPAFDASLGEPATGRVLNFSYLGSLALGERGDRDSIYDQSFAARGIFTFTKASLGFGLQYSQLSGPTRDTGGADIGRQLLGVSLTSGYQYSPKTSFEANLTAPIRIFEQDGISSEGVTGTTFVNYSYSPLTTVGLGVSAGVLTVEGSRTQTFEQALARVTYLGGGTLVYNATVGVEFRDAGDDEEVTPVLGFGLTWQAREGTRLTLSADRRVLNSAVEAGSNFVSSSVALTGSQRLGEYFQASGSVGYENADYDQVNGPGGFHRTDNYVVVQGGLTAILNRRWNASLLATYGNNQSRVNGLDFFQSLVQVTFIY